MKACLSYGICLIDLVMVCRQVFILDRYCDILVIMIQVYKIGFSFDNI